MNKNIYAGFARMSSRESSRYGTLFYIPNVIDYSRIVVLIIAIVIFRSYSFLALCFFIYVSLADCFDGWVSRRLEQESILGATLDMVIDRCFDTLLCMALGILYPQYSVGFMMLALLDISSHWLRHSYYSRKHNSHKSVDLNTSLLLGLYYRSRLFLFSLCVAYDAALISLYAYRMINHHIITRISMIIVYLSFPLATIKVCINMLQAVDAIIRLSKEPYC